jgi:hypothetical protein
MGEFDGVVALVGTLGRNSRRIKHPSHTEVDAAASAAKPPLMIQCHPAGPDESMPLSNKDGSARKKTDRRRGCAGGLAVLV